MTGWRPTSGADVARRRADMLRRARAYFSAHDILEVTTPALTAWPPVDAHIAGFTANAADGATAHLHTSPEVHMKRLIAAGYPDIASVCRVFRAGESGKRHLPEFTLAEWYRLGFGLQQIIDDTVRFIAACLDLPPLVESVAQTDYASAFEEHAGIDPLEAGSDELVAKATGDPDLRERLAGDRDAALDLIMSDQVAPRFAPDCLTVVRHYPLGQAALAKACDRDARVADRFEVFCGDLELANGYVEVTEPGEQARRLGERSDLSLIAALRHGLPGCAGVAVGIERLQMVHDQADDIRDVVSFVPTLP